MTIRFPSGVQTVDYRFNNAKDHAGYKLTAAAALQTFKLQFLPSDSTLTYIAVLRPSGVAGVGITGATVEVGIIGNTTKYLAATNIMTSGIIGATALNAQEAVGLSDSVALIATVRTTGGNVAALTAGEFVIRLGVAGTYA